MDGSDGGAAQEPARRQLHRLLPSVPLSSGKERGGLRRLRPHLFRVFQGRPLSAGGIQGVIGLAG